ncbi:hypothetical protein [Actinoallomurus soli]|uniref:hypothetical protein n=1 Tax=Actinoallomurus soli TaxID=2952535 RepID=UPI002093376D|nr:hypothetical protein [Actinoallomurus soli]MCO5968992.1 hypothetical protein [Actinoallomurus soli]
MARRLLLGVSVAVVLALLAAVWATGGLRAATRPRTRPPGALVDLGRYTVRVTDAALVHRRQNGVLLLTVTLQVTSEDRTSVLLSDFTVNAISLATAGGPSPRAAMAQGSSQGADTNMLPPHVPFTVALTYVMPRGSVVPPGFHARLEMWRYDHREDFFYGHVVWVSRKPVGSNAKDPGEFAVPLTLRREEE